MAEKLDILIIGDSFAAQYPNDSKGWPVLLSNIHNVTNLAQAGVSEYKIWKQLASIDPKDFDMIIVCHTSPYRVHTKQHPIHKTNLHKDCDLLINDIDGRSSFFNPSLRAAQGYFDHHFDPHYYEDVYQLIRSKIERIIIHSKTPCLNIDNLEASLPFAREQWNLDLTKFWLLNRGTINHYTEQANNAVLEKILNEIRNEYHGK